jgi:TonB-dependent SusC/RagA subfamily outer membrane receptor
MPFTPRPFLPGRLRVRTALAAAPIAALLAGCGPSGPRTEPEPAPQTAASRGVTSGDIAKDPNRAIEKELMARSPGVIVSRSPEGNLLIRIRGGSQSVYGNTAPLYIVDGVPYNTGSDGGLAGLNPYDIQSIKVLKDAADITMYGVRGANGVIVIKTKQYRQ